MKKHIFFLLAIMAVMFFSKCSKLELLDIDGIDAPNDGVLTILVSGGPDDGLKSVSASNGDTINIEGGNVYNFAYQSTIPMSQVQWTFSNNNTVSQDHLANNYYGRAFVISKVTLSGFDENGDPHMAELWLNNLPRVGGDPILYKGKTALGGNLYRHEFWMYKNGAYVADTNYQLKGNMTSPPWTTVITIPAADTNYRMSGDVLYPMPSNQNGHWIKVQINGTTNSNVEAAPLIKNVPALGEQWASFKGSQFVSPDNYGMMKYYIDAQGDITPGGGPILTLPGQGGDNVIRLSIIGSNVIIYQYNGLSAPSPWIQFKTNDSWATPVLSSTPMSNYPGWSQYTKPISEFPVRVQFGSNMTTMTINPNISSSVYYDGVYGGLYLSLTGIE